MAGGLIQTGIAYVTTANTGAGIQIGTPEGQIQAQRVDPHGVVLSVGGRDYSINKELLPVLGRFIFAAAMQLGVEINKDWNAEDQHVES